MNPWILLLAAVGPLTALRAEEFLDRVDEALTFSLFGDRARTRFSGTVDLEYLHLPATPFDPADSNGTDLFNPRLTLFFDAQLGPRIYVFADARVDQGFDHAGKGAQVRWDEYAVRLTPWEDARFNLQIGKFSPVVGNWMARHLSWDNPFVTAPLPYEYATAVSDLEAPTSAGAFTEPHDDEPAYDYNPIIWTAAYGTGASVSGRLGQIEYAAEVKNTSLSSRPESWDATETGFNHPTVNARLGWRPNLAWNLGMSASRGPYLGSAAEPFLPPGRDIGDYEQFLLGQDISFGWRHLQVWAEVYEARFEVPHVGFADTVASYIEAKYKFTPQWFGAVRWNQQWFDTVPDGSGQRTPWGRDLWRLDFALGYRFTAHSQLKVQFSHQQETSTPHDHGSTVAAQFTVRF